MWVFVSNQLQAQTETAIMILSKMDTQALKQTPTGPPKTNGAKLSHVAKSECAI